MVSLLKREKNELFCLQEKDVSIEAVIDYLVDNREESVYVLRNDILVGIITYGDCVRHIQNQIELINRNYKFVYDDDIDIISEWVRKYTFLNSVPIVDHSGVLLYDFRWLRNEKMLLDKGYKKRVINFSKILRDCEICQIIFINLYEECAYVKKLFEIYDISGIEVKCQRNYCESAINDILYVDNDLLRQHRVKLDCHFIQVLTITELYNFLLKPNRYLKNFKNFCKLIGRTYTSIALYQKNNFTRKIAGELESQDISFDVLTEKDIDFDAEKMEYTIKNTFEKKYDVIVTGSFDVVFTPIRQNSDYLYNLVSLFCGYQGYVSDAVFHATQERDILNNVFPHLKKIGVKILIFEVPKGQCIERMHLDSIVKYGIHKEWINIFEMELEYLRLPGNYNKGYYLLSDYESDNFSIKDGIRSMPINSDESSKAVYFFGNCQSVGLLVNNKSTIESYINKFIGKDYKIYNYVAYNWAITWEMRVPKYKQGDVLILETACGEIFRQSGYEVYSIESTYNQFEDRMEQVIWDMLPHANGMVNEEIAKEIYAIGLKQGIFE